MKKLLFIVPHAFHSKTGNAGEKTVSYYFGRFSNDGCFETAVAYVGDETNDYAAMVNQYRGTRIFSAFEKRKGILKKIYDGFRFKMLYPQLKKFVPKYYITNNFLGNRIVKILKKAKQENYTPDVIVAEFTNIIFWIDKIKRIFPNSTTVASCHDITFLSVKRFYDNSISKPVAAKYYFDNFKKREIQCLKRFDVIVTQSLKDKTLLTSESGIAAEDIFVISPFYDKYRTDFVTAKNTIIFFGAMKRNENIDAVEWFVANVWKECGEQFGGNLKFVVVGGGLPKGKADYFKTFGYVELAGFVENPEAVFNTALCFVIPLRLGAGIKVKALEAMSAGIPVLTNNIGIEGIPAKDNIDYLYCRQPEEFINGIRRLMDNPEFARLVSANAQKLIEDNFSLDKSYGEYRRRVVSFF